MQSSELNLEQPGLSIKQGLLQEINWIDKLPMALVGGCLLGLSAPGFDLWWLAWIAIAPLLVLLRSCQSKIEAALVGLVFGFGYQAVSAGWLLGLYPLRWMAVEDWIGFQAAVGVWLLESLHRALLYMGFAVLVFLVPMRAGLSPFYSRPYFPYLLSIPLLWIFFQWTVGSTEMFLGVPVNQLAYSQSRHLEIIQVAKWGGSQLLDCLILLCNAAVAAVVIELSGWVSRLADRADHLSARAGVAFDLIVVTLLIGACLFWGAAEVKNIGRSTNICFPKDLAASPAVPIAILQGNVGIEEQRSGSLNANEISQRYVSLSDGLGVPLVVLPEGVLDAVQARPGLLLSQLQRIALVQKKELLAGGTESISQGAANTVRLLGPINFSNNFYVKRRLVPFGEFLPVGILDSWLPESVKRLLSGNSQGFTASRSLRVLTSVWGKIGSSICVEVVYPRLVADEVRHGASLLVNISNLAWFHNSTLNQQILAAATLRAVENGRYMVLATNSGISAVIDPAGLITSVSLPGKKGVLIDTVQFLYKNTPFTKMWWL